jgi:hypothetical protein
MGLVGALALGLGLAFGLGGRDTAGQIVAHWYRASQEAAPKLERAADRAMEQTERMRAQMTPPDTTHAEDPVVRRRV